MMLVDHREHIKKVIFLVILNILSACTPSDEGPYKNGLSSLKNSNFKESIVSFKQSTLINPNGKYALLSAKEGAKVAYYELKDFESAIYFLKNIVVISNLHEERISAQRQMVSIYFTNLNDYKNSIIEINRLLSMTEDQDEKEKLKEKLARSYFYMNNFIQAQSEAEEVIRTGKDQETIFQMLALKGNIFLAKKNIQQASDVFHEILKKYPDKAVKENIASTLAVAYEEMKDYKKAVEVLESMKKYHQTPEYLDLRIKRLKQSEKNQPGARGLRRK